MRASFQAVSSTERRKRHRSDAASDASSKEEEGASDAESRGIEASKEGEEEAEEEGEEEAEEEGEAEAEEEDWVEASSEAEVGLGASSPFERQVPSTHMKGASQSLMRRQAPSPRVHAVLTHQRPAVTVAIQRKRMGLMALAQNETRAPT